MIYTTPSVEPDDGEVFPTVALPDLGAGTSVSEVLEVNALGFPPDVRTSLDAIFPLVQHLSDYHLPGDMITSNHFL